MADISFLKIHPNVEVAQDLGESPQAALRITPQIQLLPFDPQPYLQITSGKTNLQVANDYEVYLVRCDTKEEFNVTDHVFIRNYNGQLIIKIAYLPFDFYTNPLYLKIDPGTIVSSGTLYSNKFILTNHNAHLTSRIDYKDRSNIVPSEVIGPKDGLFQSIRLQFYFNNAVSATEVDTYYQITTSQTVNPRVSIKEYKEWSTQLFNSWTYERLARALYMGKCYINQVRNYPIDGLEYNKREGMSNISENQFVTDPDENDTITIIPLIIGDDFQTIPFKASSSQPSSTHFLSSQSTITIPV